MSGSTIGAVVGAAIGSFAGPAGARIGWMIGSIVGGYLMPEKIEGPRLKDAAQQTARDGIPRTYGWGAFPTSGNLIWVDKLKEVKETERAKGGPEQTTYKYLRSYAIAVCRGPITGYLIIKRNGKIVYDTRPDSELTAQGYTAAQIKETRAAQAKFQKIATLYLGDETQLPDPTIAAVKGSGNAPAYRGTAYIVVTDDDVTDMHGAVPQFEFVVAACGTVAVEGGTTMPRFLGSGQSSSGTSAITRPLSYDGAWVGASDTKVTLTTTTSVRSPVRYGDNIITFIYAGGTLVPMRKAAITDLTAWSDGPTPPSGANGASLYVSGARLFFWSGASATIHYLASTSATAFTTGPTFTGGFTSNDIDSLAGNGTQVLAANGYGTLWGSTNNGDTFTKGAELFGAARFYTFTRAMDCNGSRFIIGGRDDNTGGAYFTDNVGATATKCVFSVSIPSSIPNQVKHCGSGKWLIAFQSSATATTTTNRLFLSTDNGANFAPVTLPAAVHFDNQWHRSIAVDATSGRVVIAGTETGTLARKFYRSDDLVTWTEISLTGTEVNGISEIYPLTSAIIVPDAPGYMVDPSTGSLTGPDGTRTTTCNLTLRTVVEDLCASRGVTSHNATQLTDALKGYRISSETSPQQAITATMPGFFFDASEYDGVLNFPKRGGATTFALTVDDLVARDGDAIEWERVQEAELLRKVTVGYIDPATTYTPTTQQWERRSGTILAKSEGTLELPIVHTKEWAAQAAEKNGKAAWAETDKCKFSLSVKWAKLVPAQVGTLTDALGVEHRIRIMSIEDDGGIRYVEAVKERNSTYTSLAAGTASPLPIFPGSELLGPTDGLVMNLPVLRDTHDAPGLYYAAKGYLPGWNGSRLQMVRNTVWETVANIAAPCVMGTLLADLPVAERDFIDTTNTLRVRMSGQLSSVTFDNLLNESNVLAILYADGTAEILQFQTATETAAGEYSLTTLIRGRLDTAIAAHKTGDRVVLLDTSVRFFPLTSTDLLDATPFKFRNVTNGIAPANTPDLTRVKTGVYESVREWPVSLIQSSRDASSNLIITWLGRARLGTDAEPAHSRFFTGYVVTVKNGATTKSWTTTQQAFVVSSADQTSIFGNNTFTPTVTVVPASTVVGAEVGTGAAFPVGLSGWTSEQTGWSYVNGAAKYDPTVSGVKESYLHLTTPLAFAYKAVSPIYYASCDVTYSGASVGMVGYRRFKGAAGSNFYGVGSVWTHSTITETTSPHADGIAPAVYASTDGTNPVSFTNIAYAVSE